MAHIIAQISDTHIGGPVAGAGERFSQAIEVINAMTEVPDLVLLTGDLTENGTEAEWAEFRERLGVLKVRSEALAGNHDRGISELAGHRAIESGPIRLVLLDTASDCFTVADADWLEAELSSHPRRTTVIAMHHPPFETGIWWMDCVGLADADRLEAVVRRHPQVIQVLSGHVHRSIQSQWGSCGLWVCPSTSSSVAIDFDVAHDPSETGEGPMFGLHAYLGEAGEKVVSHVVPVGVAAQRRSISAEVPGFIERFRQLQSRRATNF